MADAAPPEPKPPTARSKAGLEDVVAGTSSICLVDGVEGRLLYRGYDIIDLAAQSSFAEVAYMLWHGRLPGKKDFEQFLRDFRGAIELPDEIGAVLRLCPTHALPMEVLRTAVSSLGHYDPEGDSTAHDANLRKALRLTARAGTIITAYHRIRNGMDPIKPVPGKSVAFNFLYTLFGKDPEPILEKILDVCLILHADHELNASTFSARVTAATLSDLYSAVTSAIGTLKGPLHGGANEKVMQMLNEIGEVSNADAWTRDALTRKVKIPGFGHRVYRTEDPRATVLRKHSEELAKHAGQTKWFEMSLVVEKVMLEYAEKAGKKIYPNVDFYSASVYHCMDIPTDLFTPIFALSRMVGWTAHVLEQWDNNRLIRPRAEYTGPHRLPYVAIEQRG